MIRLICELFGLIGSNFLPSTDPLIKPRLRHYLLSLGAVALLPLVLIYYWLGLGLDELCCRGYRRVVIKRPVFILGVPRSGTTALHEALAQDPQFTTQRTWECLLAPAITHRWFWHQIARIDRALGAPLRRSARWVNRRWLAPLTNAHPLSATAPEEDYLNLLPYLSAFILVVMFPHSARLWRIGRGDTALSTQARERLMRQYRASIQRHLYYHGQNHTYLAKNASFAVFSDSLALSFPDARFIACLREPERVVSSQLASIEPSLNALHGPVNRAALTRRMSEQLHTAYRELLRVLPTLLPERAVFLPLAAQRGHLGDAIRAIYQRFNLSLRPAFDAQLEALEQRARSHQSGHQHQLSDYGLSTEQVAQTFADVTATIDMRHSQPVAADTLTPLIPSPRVLVVSDAAPERNGVGSYYADLIEHMQDRLAEIPLIAPTHGDAHIPKWRAFALPGDATQSLVIPSPWALSRALYQHHPHVVIIATPGPYGVLAGMAAQRLGARIIFGLHTDYEALAGLYWRGIYGLLNRLGMALVNRVLFHQAALVVSNSEPMHALAKRKGARQARRVQTPIPRRFIDTPISALNTPPQRVLFVGRLAAEKRVEAVLDAAKNHPDLHFAIAGEGPLREQVEAAAHALPNLEYRGWLAREGIREALDDTDLLVLPSQVEAFGTVALEAMARARLTLVSAGCGIANWPAFRDALTVMAADESLTNAISRLLTQPPEALIDQAEQGRQQAHTMANDCIEQWIKLITHDAQCHASPGR